MHELTTGQKAAHAAFVTLMLDPDQQVLVIEGFAGCGKTYLVNEIIRTLPKTMKMAELVTNNQAMT
jgi:tRNA A37 threonylcarbamoyladenosine biosynthesis protein TsaE